MEEIYEDKEVENVIKTYKEMNIVKNRKKKPSVCLEDLSFHNKQTHKAYLDVVAVVSNPARYSRRYQLFIEFCERMKKEPLVRLLTVELQNGHRPFVTNSKVRLRTDSELWHKENLINIGVQSLPADWEYVAWIDTDLEFQNKNWARETIEQLQTYSVVQLFSHAVDLGPNGETLHIHTSFAYLYINGEPMNNYSKHTNYKNGHTGYAYATTRKGYNDIGGLMDFCILGAADAHMAMAFIGEVGKTLHTKLNQNYKDLCHIFQDRCERHIKRNFGCVNGTILHNFHGSKIDRQYSTRWQILLNNDYDPLRDIKKDCNDVFALEDVKTKLRDDLRRYFRSRNEDAVLLREDCQFTKQKWF